MPALLKSGLKLFPRLMFLIIFSTPVFAERIIVISDINGSYGSTTYHKRVSKAVQVIIDLKPDLVIGTGDMVAGQKQPLLDQEHLDRMWASFNQVVGDPIKEAGIDFIISPGNHDASALPGFRLEQERFKVQWMGRRPDLPLLAGSDWPRRYALWLGKTLIISIDGTRPGRLQSADLDLLQNTLERDGSKAKSIIVVSHLPRWPFARGRENDIITDQRLTALLSRYGVDFFISGHHHVFYPGVENAGPLNLSTGALGGNARSFVDQPGREPFSFTILDLCSDSFSIQARIPTSFSQLLPLTSLPAKVSGATASLQRLDTVDNIPAGLCIP